MATASKKAKHARNFQESWLTDNDFKDWLIKEVNPETGSITMRCRVCTDTKQKNIFASAPAQHGKSTCYM